MLSNLQGNRISHSGILDTLPKDIIDTLFAILPITSKRNFIRCNHELYRKTHLMLVYENDFITQIHKFYKYYLPITLSKLETYTLEMMYDGCEQMIPSNYICSHNALCNTSPFMYFYCAKPDNLSLLKKLLIYNPTHGKYITYGAAFDGHLDVLKWARENDCKWDSWTCTYAAGNGHLDVLKWARENGCEWNSDTCSNAGYHGHLHVLKWARENGCAWNSWTCAYAAQNGHLHVLKWARENGCPE